MPRHKVKIYRKRRPVRTFLRLLGVFIAAAAILLIASFFWLQNFIVHTTDGIRVDAPFLRGIMGEIPAASILPYPLPPEASPSPTPSPVVTPEPLPPGVYERVLHVPAGNLDAILDWGQTLNSFDANAVMIPLNTPDGYLWWETEIVFAHSYLLAGNGRIDLILDQIDPDVRQSALLYTFHNSLMAERNSPAARGDNWLDPTHVDIQAYLTDQALELVALGFDEIILQDFYLPTEYQLANDNADILLFLETLAFALSEVNASLSLMVREADWIIDGGLDFTELAEFITRFYTQLDTETVQNEARFVTLYTRVSQVLAADTDRFIPFAIGTVQDGNWVLFR